MSAMKTPFADDPIRPLPHHVAVIGAAGGLGQGILDVCRTEGIGFTAIVRSRPERITNVPRGSRHRGCPVLHGLHASQRSVLWRGCCTDGAGGDLDEP